MAFEEVFFAALLRTGAEPNRYSTAETCPLSSAQPAVAVMVADVDSRIAADIADLTRTTTSISVSTPVQEPSTPEFLALNTPTRSQFNPSINDQQSDVKGSNNDNNSPKFIPLLLSDDKQESDETLTVSSVTGDEYQEAPPAESFSDSDRATDNFHTPGPSASVSIGETDQEQFETTDASSVNTSPDIPLRYITHAEFAKHNKPHDMWLSIRGEVYNVTQFQHVHPGGAKLLVSVAGKDATKKFDKYHRRALLDTYKASFRIGKLEEGTSAEAAPKPKKSLLGRIGLGRKGR